MGPVGVTELMHRVVRDSKGRWCVAVPVERFGYAPASLVRELRRIPVCRDADAYEAERAAERAGMLDREAEE